MLCGGFGQSPEWIPVQGNQPKASLQPVLLWGFRQETLGGVEVPGLLVLDFLPRKQVTPHGSNHHTTALSARLDSGVPPTQGDLAISSEEETAIQKGIAEGVVATQSPIAFFLHRPLGPSRGVTG